ncbi:MAG: M16 family metallopeptidase, partial [bacterium]
YAHILDEHQALAVGVLADILSNAVFDPAEMEKEKRVILEELNTIEETPEELIHEIFQKNLFPEHPLGFPVIGKRDNITKFNREGILTYLNENYTSERLVVAAAGNVNHDHFANLVEREFQGIGNRGQRSYIAPNGSFSGKDVVDNGAIQAHICLGTHAYSYRNRKKFSLLVLNTLLGSGMSSRLFQNIREKHGLAYSVYSFVDFMYDTGLFGIYVGTDREKIDHSLELITNELDILKKETISDSELECVKMQLRGNLILGLESTSSRMNRLAKMEIYLQKYFTLNDTLNEITNVTADDLMSVANELFEMNRIQISVLRPRSESA